MKAVRAAILLPADIVEITAVLPVLLMKAD
jgi:hypothetical protein